MASPSSCPVCLASALPSFLTSLSAHGCQPPKDSATRGRKAIPCCRQSSSAPLSLRSWAKLRAWPGSVAALTTVASWRGWTTVTSKAASRPPAQRGTKISAGRRSAPGSKNLPSLLGPSPALTAVSKKASLKALCLLILSPPVPQQRAWSPMTSLRRRQAGHWAGTLGIVDWQPQPVLDCQNKL